MSDPTQDSVANEPSGGHIGVDKLTPSGSSFAGMDEVLEKADPEFTKGLSFSSGTTTLRKEDKPASTDPNVSNPESGYQPASGPYNHYYTADFTPIDISDQEDAPGRKPAPAAAAAPLDLDDLARKFFGSNTQSSGSKPASGSGNTSIHNDDQIDSPAPVTGPPTDEESQVTDPEELLKGSASKNGSKKLQVHTK